MKTRNSALFALGLAAALTLGGAMTASAQDTTRARSQRRIPVRKEQPAPQPARVDTVTITRTDTVVRTRTDTVTVTRVDTVTRIEELPLQKLPGWFFGLGTGMDIPTQEWLNVARLGWTARAHLGWYPGTSPVGIRVEGDYSNSVFIVGADRISTDLHNLIVETNQTLPKPLGLDYELNDAADPESVYTRSDHYSYASKGIPIAFFTTGLHPDYHRVSDTVDKILFPKMARIAQLVYETGFSIANTDKVLTRDNKGPRTGFDTKPAIIKQP